MYDKEMPVIRDAMRADVTVFVRGVMFAVCSIRQPTINVPDQLAVLFDGAEDESPLFGHKFDAWAWISNAANAATLWRDLLRYDEDTREGCHMAICDIMRIPGLGIVKAAFVAQLMGFNVACLDSRNVKREGRNPREFETRGVKSGRKFNPRLIERYVAETYGKAEHYWNAWCADVAAAYNRTPQQISELHLAIVPDNYVPF